MYGDISNLPWDLTLKTKKVEHQMRFLSLETHYDDTY